jgi:uncharacterized membrane protein YdjX (TVP38/TMEM64 family)
MAASLLSSLAGRLPGRAWFAAMGRKGLKQVAVVIVILAAIYALQHYLPVQAWLKAGTETYRDLGFLGILLFIATFAALTLVFVPGPTLSLTAGVLYGMPGFWAALAGASATASVCFVLARFLLHAKAVQWVSRYAAFKAVDSACRRHGARVAVLVHLSPVLPMTIANYMLSLTPLRFPRYLAANAIGMTPGLLFYVYAGSLGGALALKGHDLNASSLWILGAGRVGLWITGLSSTAVLALWIRRHSRGSATPSPLERREDAWEPRA